LFVQKLTDDAPIKPEAVYDLKTVEEVFEHFKPSVDVDFETADGSTVQENISFKNLGDFNAKNITENSKFLKDLQLQQDQYQNIIKQLKTNKLLKSVVENPDNKNAFVDVLKALIQELEDHSK
jgi:predicted component of type VI protein secretion system